MAKRNLAQARSAKNDEFYTQWHVIEKEINAYLDFDLNIFKGKTVLCPCDDPEWSNFTKYFALRFEEFGLKKLVSTSFAPDSNAYSGFYQPTLFESGDPRFDKVKTRTNGKIFTLNTNGKVNIDKLKWDYLEGNGDFRSKEVSKLRDEADIIVTNPPFSLFREFLAWVTEANKLFSVIGNINAITYKEAFPLIKGNKMWLGATNFNTGMYFRVPSDFVYANTYKFERELNGEKVNRVPGVCWFTNLDHGRRHEPLSLMTIAKNLKYSKHKEIKGKKAYDKYENYDAIEIPFADAIPADFNGVMGVPITFLDKYCPEQFVILGTSDNGLVDDKYKITQGLSQKFVDDYYEAGGTGAYKEGNPTAGLYIDGIATMAYKRLFIKHKKGKEK